jgi:hypothetical protein
LKKQSQFLKRPNDVNSLMTKLYGDFSRWGRRKNKPNSKPNKANLRPSAGNAKQVEWIPNVKAPNYADPSRNNTAKK